MRKRLESIVASLRAELRAVIPHEASDIAACHPDDLFDPWIPALALVPARPLPTVLDPEVNIAVPVGLPR